MATVTMPSADIVFDTLFAYQRSGALKSALDLDLFTAINGDRTTAPPSLHAAARRNAACGFSAIT